MATAATATMTLVAEWNPTTDAEIKLKASLTKLAASTDPVMLTPAPPPSLAQTKEQEKQQKLFLLQSKAYFG